MYESDTVGTVFQFHENVSVLYLGHLIVHEFPFSLLVFLKSKGIAHWKNFIWYLQCYWCASLQQGKGTAHILFLVTASAGI